ncbi:MAG: CBS domain-containing protein [Chitinophagaceae bacterium]
MKKVSDILARKGKNIISISPETSVLEALKLMADKNIGSVMIMKDQQFLGIMTERDYSRKVILKGKSSTDTKVEEIMTIDFPPVTPNDTIEHCMELMSERTIRYLPVFENDTVLGIISISDLVKATIMGHEETISQLKDYLHASM